MTDLRAFIEQTSEVAEAMFQPDGQMLAYIYAEDHRGHVTLFACPMGPEDEIAFRLGVPAKLRRGGFRRWCFFTEAWAAEYAVADVSGMMPLPERRADRREVVTFAAGDQAGATLIASRQIWRDRPGAPGKLMPLVFQPAKFIMAAADQRTPKAFVEAKRERDSGWPDQ